MSADSEVKNSEGTIIKNIDLAKEISDRNESVGTVVVVSGNDTDREEWEKRFKKTGKYIFNRNGTTRIVSLREKIGTKTREGNFLGTLLAYKQLKDAVARGSLHPIDNCVTLIGMLFGRGERISPFTQIEGGRKPAICVSTLTTKAEEEPLSLTALEEALLFFAPVVRYLEMQGFRGVLDKWGDETEIASIDLSTYPDASDLLARYDIIKFISRVPVTDALAPQKDWVISDIDGNVKTLIARNSKTKIIENMSRYGIASDPDGILRAGVSLGPVAVSYDLLDVALTVFDKEISADGVFIDFDPYVLMAFAYEGGKQEWEKERADDHGYGQIISMIPDFFEKITTCKSVFEQKTGRPINFKVFDMGDCVYWADIGQHIMMREKFMLLNEDSMRGRIARKIEGITDDRDANGNIIISSEIGPGVKVENSVIIGSRLTGIGSIEGSVVKYSTLNDPSVHRAFVVLSVRPTGKTELDEDSGLYRSIGSEPLTLAPGMRHGSLLLSDETLDLYVSEDTDLRNKMNYDLPIFSNKISFREAFDRSFGTSSLDLEMRRRAHIASIMK